MRRGFVYLAAVVDVFSRRVLAHRVSITMEADFCVGDASFRGSGGGNAEAVNPR